MQDFTFSKPLALLLACLLIALPTKLFADGHEGKPSQHELVTYLGVEVHPAPPFLSSQLDLPEDVGLIIEHVEPDSPAARAGLERHDVLHKLDDQILVNPDQLHQLVRSREAGKEVELSVIRKGKPLPVSVTLDQHEAPPPFPPMRGLRLEQPPPMPQPIEVAFLGVATGKIPSPMVRHLRLQPGYGLLVIDVVEDSPALRAGLQRDDVLFKLDGELLRNSIQLREMIRGYQPGDEVEVVLIREGEPLIIDVQLIGREVIDRPQLRLMFGRRPGEEHRMGELMLEDMEGEHVDEQIRRLMQEQRERMRQMLERHRDGLIVRPFEDMPRHELDFELRLPDGAGQANIAVYTFSDGKHVVTITQTAEGKHLLAKDAKGDVLFDGPIDTDEQLEAVPAGIREKMEQLHLPNLELPPAPRDRADLKA